MNYGKEFEKYATKHHGINSMHYDKILSSMYPQGMTPNIVEERQMNVAIFDVFSRLMMDRIIFLGTGINDQVANVVQAQLLFLESIDASKTSKFTLTLQEEVFMLDLEFMTLCNSLNLM